jgi:hypothetical protein
MADQPRIQQPYANMIPPATGIAKTPKVPVGSQDSKRDQGKLALQGLIGAK